MTVVGVPWIVPAMAPRLRCLICGDVLGVYEPLLVVGEKGGRTSSLAHEPLLASGDEMLMHRSCGIDFGGAPAEGYDPRGSGADAPDG
jgi:hypothetical protein